MTADVKTAVLLLVQADCEAQPPDARALRQLAHIKAPRPAWVWDVVDFYPQPKCARWHALLSQFPNGFHGGNVQFAARVQPHLGLKIADRGLGSGTVHTVYGACVDT